MPAEGHGLLDTNILILRRLIDPAELPAYMSISAITLAELSAGPQHTTDPRERARRLDVLQRAEAAYRAARTALQVHGAIGYALESPLSRWLTTVRSLRASWGTPAFHRDRIMTELCHAVPPGGTPV